MSDTTRFTLHVDVASADAERACAALADDSPTGMLNIVSGGLRWHGISARVTMSDTTALYASRPQQVEAIQWTGDIDAIKRSPFRDLALWGGVDGAELFLRAGKDGAQGWVPVPLGHWLVRNPGDPSDNWPVDPDYFAGKYQPAGGSDE